MEERLKVLVIEDEDILRKGLILTTDWKTLGLVVIGEADNGIDGEELARKLRPDIIVTDIAMPGQDGLALIGNLIEELLDSEFIIISGHAQFSYAQQALNYGVKGYILKPIDPREFVAVLHKSAEEIRSQIQKRSDDEFLKLRELSSSFLQPRGDYRDQYIQNAVKTIEDHYAESLNIADLSEHMGISERTLSTLL
jgi:two-component system response regulator YesN